LSELVFRHFLNLRI